MDIDFNFLGHVGAEVGGSVIVAATAHTVHEAVVHGYHVTMHLCQKVRLVISQRKAGRWQKGKSVIHVIVVRSPDDHANDNNRYKVPPDQMKGLWIWRDDRHW
jgi:hypothetical protein